MSTQLLTTQELGALDAWVCLLRGHAATRRKLTAELTSTHGLTINEYEALLILSRADGRRMRRVDLADALQLTASGVTRLLDGLERHALVEKATCSSDARVTYAQLTKTGLEKLKKASSSHIRSVEALFEERYTPAEIAALAELLARLPGAKGGSAEDCAA
jgi:DNA-binding MarR family transcriptional regulator